GVDTAARRNSSARSPGHWDPFRANGSAMTEIEKTSLVAFARTGNRQPLYVAHGAGGGVLFLKEFGELMEGKRPVFGFRAHGLDGSSPPDQNVFSMARRYARDLYAV